MKMLQILKESNSRILSLFFILFILANCTSNTSSKIYKEEINEIKKDTTINKIKIQTH